MTGGGYAFIDVCVILGSDTVPGEGVIEVDGPREAAVVAGDGSSK